MVALKTKTSPEETAQDARADETPVIRLIHPRREYCFGRYLGFTFSDNSLQMAAALHLGSRIRLLDVTKQYFSAGDLSSPERHQQVLRREIRYYVSHFGGRRPIISLTLTGSETALRMVTLPRLRKREMAAALQFELGRQLPFPPEDCWIDHHITEVIKRGNDVQFRAAALAATRVAVQERLAPFEQLGIEVNRIYHTQDVIGQLLTCLADFDETRDFMLVDVHPRRTEISYYHGSNLQFYHVSSLGSSFLANRTDPTVFEYFAESLASELHNSLDYYSGQYASHAAQEIYIYGDLSYTDELIALLTDRLGFTFRRFPTENLTLTRNRDLSFADNLAVCLPAVAAAVNQSRIADLLPYPMKIREKRRRVDRVGIAGLTLVAIMMAMHWLGMATQIESAQSQLSELQRQAGQFQTSEIFATYSRVKTQMAANQAYLDKAQEKPSLLGLNLKELTRLLPEAVQLYSLEYTAAGEDRNMLMSGLITAKDTPPEVILAELVENLTASPFYENIKVERHVKQRKAGQLQLDFSLSMKGII